MKRALRLPGLPPVYATTWQPSVTASGFSLLRLSWAEWPHKKPGHCDCFSKCFPRWRKNGQRSVFNAWPHRPEDSGSDADESAHKKGEWFQPKSTEALRG